MQTVYVKSEQFSKMATFLQRKRLELVSKLKLEKPEQPEQPEQYWLVVFAFNVFSKLKQYLRSTVSYLTNNRQHIPNWTTPKPNDPVKIPFRSFMIPFGIQDENTQQQIEKNIREKATEYALDISEKFPEIKVFVPSGKFSLDTIPSCTQMNPDTLVYLMIESLPTEQFNPLAPRQMIILEMTFNIANKLFNPTAMSGGIYLHNLYITDKSPALLELLKCKFSYYGSIAPCTSGVGQFYANFSQL